MFFSQYEYFIKVAEERSLSKAAQQLCISQSGMSKYLKRLEGEVGTALFDREKTSLQLTRVGRLYLEYARQVAELEQRFKNDLARERNLMKRKIVIGTSQWRSSFVLPKLLPLIKQRYPLIDMTVRIEKTHRIIDAMKNNQIDLAILNLYSILPDDEFMWEKIVEERILLAVCTEHPLFRNITSVKRDFVFDIRRNLIPRLHVEELRSTEFYLAEYSKDISAVTQGLLARAAVVPKEVKKVDSLVAALYNVSANQSFAFIPESGIYTNYIPANVVLFFIGEPILTWPLIIAAKASSQHREMLKILSDLLREIYDFGGQDS